MKKKIAIFGSTGSIGKALIDIIKKDKKNFEITLLTANKNYKDLAKQAKLFKVKNLIILDSQGFVNLKKDNYCKKINIYQNFNNLDKIFKKRNDFIMNSITGLDGLSPTLSAIKNTKNILIANKEAIICGWNLINKKIKKYKTNFIPVDSEHFSIWSLLQNNTPSNIEKIYITASGGPFLKLPKEKFHMISIKKALKHPNWKMGKKISIDSATLMNKLFEVIEAKNIFNIPYKKISVLTHPESYVHAIVKFTNGLTKILIHDTSMKIPIFNSLYSKDMSKTIVSKELNIRKLNNLCFLKPDLKKFPALNIIKILPIKLSLFETVLVTVNDEIVKLFLNKKIRFNQIVPMILKIIKSKDFIRYKKITPKNLKNITDLNKFVCSKIQSLVYKSS
jgi:1-deoxy-D-xylulose-5-phosphate reductoisomerase